ncbi:hypothetical protein HYC85_024315 [Camellia sinensis]|uniref:Thioredoxin domain-containing protein n=1 Tax=Camellia sinensis TaxID=4442 RepID=A0A7J7G7T9_CAMSI|nr:hypothetical protein HYC85_024315 [Camellia sinensis]
MAIDWAKEYQTFTDDWNNQRNSIVHAERSNEVCTSSDPFILWFRRHTHLVLSNPSDIAALRYQCIGGSLEGLAHRRDRLDFEHFSDDPSMAIDIIATLVPYMNMPSSEPSVPPLHPTPCHAHRSDPFDVEHFGEGPSIVWHVMLHLQQCLHRILTQLNLHITYPNLSLSEILSCPNIHPHTMAIYWNPSGHHPHTGQRLGSPVTPLAPLSTACLSNMMLSSSTLTTPDHLTVPSSLIPLQINVDKTIALVNHVVANFSASWCGPCRVIAPFYSKLSHKYPILMFLSVDVDELTEFSTTWDIKATPVFFFFRDGQQVEKLIRANKSDL